MGNFSHLDKKGAVRMVDVTDKNVSYRTARAEGQIGLLPTTIAAITDNAVPKGNVLTTAKIAGIQAAKKTGQLIPLCHQLNLSWVELEFELGSDLITIHSVVKTTESTGVEMEALTAVATAALTIYDMTKAIDHDSLISDIQLVSKKGGKSGDISRKTSF